MTDPPVEPRVHHGLLHGDFDLTDAEQERRDLKHRITSEARTLVERLVLLDADACSEPDLAGALAAVERASEQVEGLPSHVGVGGLNRAPGWAAALTERSPVTGRSNPLAAPLTLAVKATAQSATLPMGGDTKAPTTTATARS